MRAKTVVHFVDSEGFIIHQESDLNSRAGDSLQRTGMFILFSHSYIDLNYNSSFNAVIKTQVIWKNVNRGNEPTRHWDNRYWPGKPGYMSRDNLFPIFCCMALFSRKLMWGLLLRLVLRFGFLWNTKKIGQQNNDWKIPDFMGPSFFFIAFRKNPIIAFISDLYLYIQLIVRFHKAEKDWDDVGDDLNLVTLIETYRNIRTTWILNKIMKMYKNNRPKAGPILTDEKGLYQALRWYFHQPEAPPLDELLIAVIDKRWPG